jgi:hypothetical protein
MWRMIGDFWDRWYQLKDLFTVCNKWTPYIGEGHWPDADMLPLGRIGIRAEHGDDRMTAFTKDEQITLMTLFSIFRSPLMFGGDLPSNDAFTLSLLTNEEVLDIHKNSINNKQLFRTGDLIAWTADDPKTKDKYLALFNASDTPDSVKISVKLEQLGLKGNCTVRDLWSKKDMGKFNDEFASFIKKHGAGLYKVHSCK